VGHQTLTIEERNDPQWDPDNRHAWSAFFAWQREDRFRAYDGPGPPPENFNSEGQRRWWSAPGRTLTWVMDHIANGNNPPLAMPPPPPRHNMGPRRSPSSSSSPCSSASPRFSPYGLPSPHYLAPVKDERESPRRSSGSPVIRDRRAPPSPPCGCLRLGRPKPEPKKEWMPPLEYKAAALELADSEDPKEFPGQRMLERASANELARWQARFPVPLATGKFLSRWSAQARRPRHRHREGRGRPFQAAA
jgi:hypothetical protein